MAVAIFMVVPFLCVRVMHIQFMRIRVMCIQVRR